MPEGKFCRALLFLGGSSEIAQAALRCLDEPGTLLLAHHRDSRAQMEELAAQLEHSRLVALQADFCSDAGARELGEAVDRELQLSGLEALDGIVIAPSSAPVTERFHKKAWESFSLHLDVQVRGPALVLARHLPAMAKRRSGRVVFVLSSYTLGHPPAGLADYVTAKHAQLGLMRALAAEYADKNLQINAVSPSMVETAFLSEVPRVVVEMNADRHPLRRNATPADVAPMIAFLLSNAASYICGENIAVTGGAPS